jgi:hypothetical protein
MSENTFSHLQLYGADCPQAGQSLYWDDATVLRERLLLEISTLNRQREQLEQVDGKMNYSLQQTCKEMIHSRQVLYRQLSR